MRLVRNTGTDRVIDLIRPEIGRGHQLDVLTPALSLFAFAEVNREVREVGGCRLLLPPNAADLGILGTTDDRPARNRLQSRWLAKRLLGWIENKAEIRRASGPIPQGAFVIRNANGHPVQVLHGSLAFSTDGLGLTPGNPMSLIQTSETPEEAALLSQWFDAQWSALPADSAAKRELIDHLKELAGNRDPLLVYALILHHIFRDRGDDLDEERVVKTATGIRNTVVWKKLFKFQRDGVVGAIDKLNRFGGCIIADSVGLGKTFEALAIIKYHELRNDRVLVLCPKRLRDNWTLYKANDRRNFLAPDRFNYDVLNHTDLSRNGGLSGDIDLAQQFIELAAEAINRCKRLAIVDGIKYQRLGDEHYYAQELFEREELTGYLKNLLDAKKSVYEQVVYDSPTEAAFADQLEKTTAIKVYAKLPGWFTVPTPLGGYNPDWAVLVEEEGEERLYFVVETKGKVLFKDALRPTEQAKIECGREHFKALEVGESPARYVVASSLEDLLTKTR